MYKSWYFAVLCCGVVFHDAAVGMSKEEFGLLTQSIAAFASCRLEAVCKAAADNLGYIARSSLPEAEVQRIYRDIANHPAFEQWRNENPTLLSKVQSLL